MQTVERSVTLQSPIDEVWDALTDPHQLSSWFGALVDLDVRPGGTGRFVSDDGEVRDAVVVAVDAPRHVTFQWWPVTDGGRSVGPSTTRVSFDLEPIEDGTRLTVVERGFVRPGAGGGTSFARACA
jgi:uncharacterized protein YndB with AHSA1/START domain